MGNSTGVHLPATSLRYYGKDGNLDEISVLHDSTEDSITTSIFSPVGTTAGTSNPAENTVLIGDLIPSAASNSNPVLGGPFSSVNPVDNSGPFSSAAGTSNLVGSTVLDGPCSSGSIVDNAVPHSVDDISSEPSDSHCHDFSVTTTSYHPSNLSHNYKTTFAKNLSTITLNYYKISDHYKKLSKFFESKLIQLCKSDKLSYSMVRKCKKMLFHE